MTVRRASGHVNAHTHIYSGLAPLGMPAPDETPRSFPEILERIWWRLDRALDADTLRAAARFYVTEALEAGTTTLIDHHESPSFIEGSLEILADACQELGMRALLCYGATERNGGRIEAKRGLAECRRFVLANERPLVRGVVGLHASFTVSDDTIREAGALCRDLDTVLHVHLGEDASDVDDARSRGYDGPLERLLALDALPPGSIAAHGVHLDAAQIRRAAERSVWIVQNPRSNHGNGVGYPPALAASERVALGTDGYPARMDEEWDALRREAAAHGDRMDAVERRIDAGHALVAERFVGAYAIGPDATDVATYEDGRLQALTVDGRSVVEDGRLVTANADAVRAEAAELAPRLWARMAEG